MKFKETFTYDDLLLEPQFSYIKTRSDVSLDVSFKNGLYSFPIIPANMKTVISLQLANMIIDAGGLAIFHRFIPFKEQMVLWEKAIGLNHQFGLSIGVKDEDFANATKMVMAGVGVICIDVAHGDSKLCIDMCKHLDDLRRNRDLPLTIIAGNIATANAAIRLWNAGADVVKCGIGSGAICSTRVETGNGVPQLSVLMDVDNARKKLRKYGQSDKVLGIIADGGIKNVGDCVKALCFADMVMAGNLFAGTDEAPGENVIQNGVSYKRYDGSSTHKDTHVEGVRSLVESKGPVNKVIQKINDGIKSGCSYQGVESLYDLKKRHKFIRITNAGLRESHPHDVMVIK